MAPPTQCHAAVRDRKPGRRGRTYLATAALRRRLAGSMVVALVDGDEHILDFGSGKLTKRSAPAVVVMLPLQEDEVTKERLEEILGAAGITTSLRGLRDAVHV